ncbi:MAG: foldase [Firmicutes bacterium]|nr:foldase [Bacillota bacterium]
MRKWLLVGIVLALIAGLGVAVYTRSAVLSVNGDRISPDEFYKALQNESGKQVLDRLIIERLVKQEAKRQNIAVSREDVDKEIARIKTQFLSDEEFKNALKDAGMEMSDLQDVVGLNLLIKKLTLKDVKITEDDIKSYFDENKESLGQPEKVKVRHILVETREEAEQILKDLKAGKDFAALAVAKSTDPGSKDNGGDMGFITRGETEEAFEKAAFALKAGELSDVVQTSYGFHVIRVDAKEEARPATLEGSRAKIVEALESSKAKPVETLVNELKSASNVRVYWERYKYLEHVPAPAAEPEKK